MQSSEIEAIINEIRIELEKHTKDNPELLTRRYLPRSIGSDNPSTFVEVEDLNEWVGPNGYLIRDGEVVGLRIIGCRLKTIPVGLSKLIKLKVLILGLNEFVSITPLESLTELEVLHLGRNQIQDILCLKSMKRLKELHLWKNNVSDISVLKSLPQLESLSLEGNRIEDISVLSSLHCLNELDISYNPILDISPLWQLNKLTVLTASGLKLTDISKMNLPKLQELDFSDNELIDISSLSRSKHLKELDLAYNRIEDVSPLRGFEKLEVLTLEDNSIEYLPEWLYDVDQELTGSPHTSYPDLNLDGNPIKNVPIELLDLGRDAVRDYFKSLENGAQPINEVKVILLGEGAAGKTSLLNYLVGKEFNKYEAQTHGININMCKLANDVTIKLWDFGGQDIMHHTHQFFLTRKAYMYLY